ncbi:hypothetical protein GCM10010390_20300 [Streptomyces mordarskii]|uniref:Uncharacterized protein n=1 Tax=Streptomyces mordarskii TaxID=1226758 RepID=A0ABN1CFA3_9ACTN
MPSAARELIPDPEASPEREFGSRARSLSPKTAARSLATQPGTTDLGTRNPSALNFGMPP